MFCKGFKFRSRSTQLTTNTLKNEAVVHASMRAHAVRCMANDQMHVKINNLPPFDGVARS